MFVEGSNNEILAIRGESDHPNATVFGAFDPADQAFLNEARSTAILIEPGVRSTIGPDRIEYVAYAKKVAPNRADIGQ